MGYLIERLPRLYQSPCYTEFDPGIFVWPDIDTIDAGKVCSQYLLDLPDDTLDISRRNPIIEIDIYSGNDFGRSVVDGDDLADTHHAFPGRGAANAGDKFRIGRFTDK